MGPWWGGRQVTRCLDHQHATTSCPRSPPRRVLLSHNDDDDDDDVAGGDDGGEELGNGDGLDRHHITNQLRRVLKTYSSSPQQSIASTRARD